jgi:hypothetical protein
MDLKQSAVGILAVIALIVMPLAPTTAPGSIALAQTADPPSRVGRLNYMSGQVSFAPGGIDQWAAAVLNYPLTTGTALWADDGARAEFHIGSTAVRMDQATEVDLLNLDDQTVQLRVPQGIIDIGLHDLAADEQFEIDTPSAAVTLARTGHYRIAVDDAGQSHITVWSGQAEVATSSQTFVVNAGQTVIISDNAASPYQLVPTTGLDAFGQWCLAREQQETQALQAAAPYVPNTMTGFEDLNAYGAWRSVSGYGVTWFPRVQSGWAPYRHGRWVWISPWGWTWIDNSPWGFAPFHYGRWALIGGQWGWVPGPREVRPIFAPALVVFVLLTGGGIGWFPLAPREVYVPPYRYSPAYYRNINITVVNITVVNVTNVHYTYRHLPKAITVVRREAFVRSDPVPRSILAAPNPEIANGKVAASAPVPPTLPSMLGRSDQAASRTPPAVVRQRPVVVKAQPPHPTLPPEVARQAQPRSITVKPAIVSRPTAAPGPTRPIQPVTPAPRPNATTPPRVTPVTPSSAPQPGVPTPRRRPTPQPTQPGLTGPQPSPVPTPRGTEPQGPPPVPSQPGVPTPHRRPLPTQPGVMVPPGPTPVPTPRRSEPPSPAPIPTQPPVPTPRPRPIPQPTHPGSISPQPSPAPTPRRIEPRTPTPVPPRPSGPTPRSRPTVTPNCNPHSRDYDPSRCPTPTPQGTH